MPVPRKVSMASRGVLTIGWPFTLKLVLSTISRPVSFAYGLEQRVELGIVFRRDGLNAGGAVT